MVADTTFYGWKAVPWVKPIKRKAFTTTAQSFHLELLPVPPPQPTRKDGRKSAGAAVPFPAVLPKYYTYICKYTNL